MGICVIGSLNMDLVVRVKEIPKKGETVIGKDFSTVPGGKGANQAVAASRLGSKTFMIGKVGDDSFAKNLKESLASSDVDIKGLQEEKNTPTGVALISVDEHGRNSIIVAPGANFEMRKEDIDKNMSLLENSKIVVLQHEIPIETVNYALETAKSKGKITVLNPAPADEVSLEALKGLDFIIPNEHELETLCKQKITDEKSMIEGAKSLIEKGVKNVIITLGEKGCLHVTESESIKYDAFKVGAVDTTAAGDSFIGGFCANYLKTEDIKAAIVFGQKTAALSVTKYGAQSSIPTLEEFEEFWR